MAIYVAAIDHTCSLLSFYTEIQLLEYPIPPRPRSSQKPSSADISETESPEGPQPRSQAPEGPLDF